MKILLLILFVLVKNCYGQDLSIDFKTIPVGKNVKEFPDNFDLNSPLNSFVTFKYASANGKNGLLQSVNSIKTKRYFPDSTATNSLVPADERNRYLNIKINEVIIYKDSVAFVISQDEDIEKQSYYSIRSFYLEGGKWVTSGESTAKSIEQAHQFISDRAILFYEDFQSAQKN